MVPRVAMCIHWKMQSLADLNNTHSPLVRAAHIRKRFTRFGNVYVVLVTENENETVYKYSFNRLWQWSGSSTIKLCSLVRLNAPHNFVSHFVVSDISSWWNMCKVPCDLRNVATRPMNDELRPFVNEQRRTKDGRVSAIKGERVEMMRTCLQFARIVHRPDWLTDWWESDVHTRRALDMIFF